MEKYPYFDLNAHAGGLADVESDRTKLPQDLLVDIATKLECVEQLVRFSAVCSSWKIVYDKVKPTWTPLMPWFILPVFHRNDFGNFRTVFDPNFNKSYEMYLPELFGCRCWGCHDEWIFTLNLDMEIRLFNPLTKTQLSLPSTHTISYSDVNNFDEDDQTHFLRKYIQKVVVLHVPPSNELVVLLVCNYSKCIAYAKPGDSQWGYMEGPDPSPLVKDVVKIENYLFILCEDWSLSMVGIDYFSRPNNYEANVFLTECEQGFDDNEVYLVESTGYLLLVYPFYADFTDYDDPDEEFQNPKTITEVSIDVFIYDSDTKIWIETRDIGDAASFVGGGSAMSVCASKATNCRRNGVYFVAVNPENVITLFRSEEVNPLGKDIGVFDLEDRCIEKFYHEDYSPRSEYCPPFWFMPKLV